MRIVRFFGAATPGTARRGRVGGVVVVVTTIAGTVVVVVVVTTIVGMVVVVVVAVELVGMVAGPGSVEGTVTVIDCGEPVSVVRALPAGSDTENDAAAVSVAVTAPPPAVAMDVAVTVHTVVDVWAIDVIAEMPAVRTKSVPVVVVAVVDREVQSSWWLPVTVKVIVAELDVAADAATVAEVGADV